MVIQYEVNNELVLVDALAQALGSDPAAKAIARLGERIVEAHGDTRCDLHYETPIVTLVMSETYGIGVRVSGCCQTFVDHIQATVRQIMFQNARLSTHNSAALTLFVAIEGLQTVFEFNVAQITRVTIGRIDPDTGERPDIDLTGYGAYENGVSRRHAAIITWNRGLFVIDEGSPNGTFLNGKRLAAGEPCALKYGDQIRIGRLVLNVTLDYPAHALA